MHGVAFIKLGVYVNRDVDVTKSDRGVTPSQHKNWSFPLRFSAVNLTKSAVSYAFGHIY